MGLRCRLLGHRWIGTGPFEHMCWNDRCWHCRATRWVHLTGPWPHTCGEDGR